MSYEFIVWLTRGVFTIPHRYYTYIFTLPESFSYNIHPVLLIKKSSTMRSTYNGFQCYTISRGEGGIICFLFCQIACAMENSLFL